MFFISMCKILTLSFIINVLNKQKTVRRGVQMVKLSSIPTKLELMDENNDNKLGGYGDQSC